MKSFIFFVILVLAGFTVNGQVLVYSQNKCYPDKVGDTLESIKSEFGQELNAQVDAGKLINWGILTHGWGDEWNLNIYYWAESIPAFQTAFNEAVKNASEKYPESMKKFQEACFEHKDSMYNVAYAYPPPPGE
jgi:hypothetical protein